MWLSICMTNKLESSNFAWSAIHQCFTGLDEINRAPPKTPAASLYVMEEKQVTIEGITHKLPAPFITMATQTQLSKKEHIRYLRRKWTDSWMKMSMGYPDCQEEKSILLPQEASRKDDYDIEPITSPKKVVAMQKALETVHVDTAILSYIVELVHRNFVRITV